MKNKILTLTLCICLEALTVYGQDRTIKGNITAFKTYPLNNVSVHAKKSKQSAVSDSLGNFSITCNKKDVLQIYASGFHAESFKIKNNDALIVNLIYQDDNISYKSALKGNHLKKEALDYCIENLLVDNNNFDRMQSIFQVIQFVYPSAKFANNDLNAGGANSIGRDNILLQSRGVGSAQGGIYALLVVDGIVVNEIASVTPQSVKSVKVLIGNQAAHWGTRGANGVIEITTKP